MEEQESPKCTPGPKGSTPSNVMASHVHIQRDRHTNKAQPGRFSFMSLPVPITYTRIHAQRTGTHLVITWSTFSNFMYSKRQCGGGLEFLLSGNHLQQSSRFCTQIHHLEQITTTADAGTHRANVSRKNAELTLK